MQWNDFCYVHIGNPARAGQTTQLLKTKFYRMKKTAGAWIVLMGLILFYGCGNSSKISEPGISNSQKRIHQQEDGTISLKLDNADCYSDMGNPSGNTAEWSVVVSKRGRYNVWLSSATRDTTSLNYKNSVLVSVQDNRIEARPACDRIILNSSDVSYPYYRAESFLGSMYIRDTGELNVQVISEKILPKNYNENELSGADLSKLISVSLTPETR